MERNTFERKLLDRIEQAVRSEGFANMQTRLSSKAWTVSADREGLRILVHVTAGDQPPRATAAVDALKGRDIRLKALAPAQAAQINESDPQLIGGLAGTPRRRARVAQARRKPRKAPGRAAQKSRSRR